MAFTITDLLMPVAPEMLGRFVWHDLMTTDVARALNFYQQLFPEWVIDQHDIGDGATYHLIRVGGFEVGGLVSMPSDAPVASHWIAYVAVDDCSAAVRRADGNGGRCVVPALSVPHVGKFVVIEDGSGAVIKPYEVAESYDLPPSPTSGHFAWDELLTKDLSKARRFYDSVFGWSSIETVIPDVGPYVLFKVGARDVAGALAMPLDATGPSQWLPYLYAEDVDARSAQAVELGSTICVPPRDIPGLGRFSVHTDPTGALFTLFRLVAHA